MDWYKMYNVQKPSFNKSSINSEEDIPNRLSEIKQEKNRLIAEEGKLIEKGMESFNPDILMKAHSAWHDVQQKSTGDDSKSILLGPNDFNANGLGFKTKQFTINPGTLRRIYRTTPVIKAIISTRQTQVSEFARPQRNRFQTGFRIRKKGDYFSDQEDELTDADKSRIKELTEFVLTGGDQKNSWYADNFDTFLKKLTADSFVLDSACFEIVRNKKGLPVKYFCVDGGTIFHSDSIDDEDYSGENKQDKGYYPSYVQVIEGNVHAEYYPWELCFGKRNTTTDIYANGYGRSELEDLVSIITWMLYGDAYNGKFFTQGSAPRGLLKISGNVNRTRLNQFRHSWQSMVSGVDNAWKVPVIESDNMEWVDLQKSNADMQFGAWQEYLIKICCAIFKISPEEIGFASGSANSGNPFGKGGEEARLSYSKDKGLRPLLKSIEFWINKFIINPLDPDYEFVFMGIDQESEEKELDLLIKKVQNGMGYKEFRKKLGLPEELEEGDFPLNSVYIQMQSNLAMQQAVNGNTETVDEDSNEVWDALDRNVTKAIQYSIPGHQDNPMMTEALEFFSENILGQDTDKVTSNV